MREIWMTPFLKSNDAADEELKALHNLHKKKKQKTFTNEKKKQQTSVTENSSIPFFYTANSGRGFYRFILNVNIPVETSQ